MKYYSVGGVESVGRLYTTASNFFHLYPYLPLHHLSTGRMSRSWVRKVSPCPLSRSRGVCCTSVRAHIGVPVQYGQNSVYVTSELRWNCTDILYLVITLLLYH
jgi:hypothetical protein